MIRGSAAALEALERVQRSMNQRLGYDPTTVAARQLVRDVAEETLVRYGAAHGFDDAQIAALRDRMPPVELPTPYEDEMGYRIITGVAAKVEATIGRHGFPFPSAPVLGTVPSGECNAMTVRVGTGEHLVLIEDGLFNFANLVSKAVAACLPSGDEDGRRSFRIRLEEIQPRLADDPSPILRLGEVLVAYLADGNPGLAKPYMPDPSWEPLSRLLTQGMETFVLAHEYGHVIDGHLDAPEGSRPVPRTSEEEILFGWRQELEADLRGMQLAVQTLHDEEYDVALSYLGVELTFGAFELIERGLSALRTGVMNPSPGSETHPPAAIRRRSAAAALPELLGSAEAAEGALELAGHLAELLDHLWSRMEPVFVELHRQGVRPHERWGSEG